MITVDKILWILLIKCFTIFLIPVTCWIYLLQISEMQQSNKEISRRQELLTMGGRGGRECGISIRIGLLYLSFTTITTLLKHIGKISVLCYYQDKRNYYTAYFIYVQGTVKSVISRWMEWLLNYCLRPSSRW